MKSVTHVQTGQEVTYTSDEHINCPFFVHFNLHDRPNLHPLQMESALNYLLRDLEFCIDHCEMTDAQAEEYLETCDTLGVSSDYFAYEFLCTTSSDIHNDDYLNIEQFNTIHGIYWEEQ